MLKMKQRLRIYYTETDKALIRDRWHQGESLNSIARRFGRHHSAIQGILARTGGIRPPVDAVVATYRAKKDRKHLKYKVLMAGSLMTPSFQARTAGLER
jgi:IS30 family transposase